MNGRMMTTSGNIVDFETGQISKIDINDIAHSLSLQNRFAGHTVGRYSVAYHSWLVSCHVSQENELWGLLHDAAEAYLGDVIRPVRELIHGFEELENRILRQIAKEFDLCWPIPEEVFVVDNQILAAEVKSPLVYGHDVIPLGAEGVEPINVSFDFLPDKWLDDYYLFMNRFFRLAE
jgi:hypothetical protein